MKSLKFRSYLVTKILSGEKRSTWRLFDDKDLQAGDQLSFIEHETGQEFSKAKIIKTLERPACALLEEKVIGSEKYENNNEMYADLESLYKQPVGPDALVKIIYFQLVDK